MAIALPEKYKKYLPSRKFIFIFAGGIVLVLGFIILSSHFGSHQSFGTKPPVSAEGTLGDVVYRDSNANGIADWEESLWGLDPNGNGPANKKTIDEKKTTASIAADTSGVPESQTDAFSKELLSTIIALRQSGTLTPETVANVAASLDETIDTKHSDPATYSKTDMKLYPRDTAAAKSAYRAALKSIIDQYADVDLGSEVTIMTSGMQNGSGSALKRLQPLSEAYTKLAKQIIGLTTPPAAAQNALDLANATAEMGAALVAAQNLYTDTLTGMVGIDDYTKASALADRATITLTAYFAS